MLPKIQKPLFEMVVPSKGTSIEYHPFVTKEEKILLIAQEAGDEKSIVRAIKQILGNCVTTPGFNVDDLTTFDLEYMFIQLRSKSVNNMVQVSYRDMEDNKVRDFEIDLDEIPVPTSGKTNKIMITDTIGLVMKYPSVTMIENAPDTSSEIEMVEYLILNCIESVFDEEDLYIFADQSLEERKEFYGELDLNTLGKIREFFDNLPKLYYEIEYVNDNGRPRKIELKSLRDFFSWG